MLKKSMISIPATDPPSLVSPPANSYVSDPCEILLTGLQTDVELTDEQALSKVFAAIGLKNYHKFLANTRAWKPKNRRRPAPENTRSFIFKLSSPSVRDNCMMNASKLASVNTNELFAGRGTEPPFPIRTMLRYSRYFFGTEPPRIMGFACICNTKGLRRRRVAAQAAAVAAAVLATNRKRSEREFPVRAIRNVTAARSVSKADSRRHHRVGRRRDLLQRRRNNRNRDTRAIIRKLATIRTSPRKNTIRRNDRIATHSTRHAANSAAKRLGVNIDSILQTAGWSNASTFAKFYDRPVVNDNSGLVKSGASRNVAIITDVESDTRSDAATPEVIVTTRYLDNCSEEERIAMLNRYFPNNFHQKQQSSNSDNRANATGASSHEQHNTNSEDTEDRSGPGDNYPPFNSTANPTTQDNQHLPPPPCNSPIHPIHPFPYYPNKIAYMLGK
ncbi:unnamed protein product [Trichogramma brassicae]|uniref:Tyr recombinase domain-containing protein n=1 Tax=Trichogramma brassicae TaxID=86971 RepID=A0A6H5I4Z4_9HYME|nr:unnamed protein product [Trichogramma brassicae]